MTTTDDLAAWLRATLDRVEQQAKAANGGGAWHYSGGDTVDAWTLYDEHWAIASLKTYRHSDYDYAERMPAMRHPAYVDADANGAHIAFWDPARVLRLVEATRRILDICEADLRQRGDGAFRGDVDRPTWDVLAAAAQWLDDQAGFRDEWRM